MIPNEINEAVARKLGWKHHPDLDPVCWQHPGCEVYLRGIPDYCHSIAAAWEIVEKQREKGYFRMFLDRELMGHGQRLGYVCVFGVPGSAKFIEEWAPTAPMAICLAFLKLP